MVRAGVLRKPAKFLRKITGHEQRFNRVEFRAPSTRQAPQIEVPGMSTLELVTSCPLTGLRLPPAHTLQSAINSAPGANHP